MCFSPAAIVWVSREDVTDWRLLAAVSTRRWLETADTRHKGETRGVQLHTHLSAKDRCPHTRLEPHAGRPGETCGVCASQLPLPPFLADKMAFNLKTREQRASARLGKSTKQRPRQPHSSSLPFKGTRIQPPQPAGILSRSTEGVGGCSWPRYD